MLPRALLILLGTAGYVAFFLMLFQRRVWLAIGIGAVALLIGFAIGYWSSRKGKGSFKTVLWFSAGPVVLGTIASLVLYRGDLEPILFFGVPAMLVPVVVGAGLMSGRRRG
ncbi:MAG: hypothetical protein AAGI08_00770 [Bacteroidota bacterium]